MTGRSINEFLAARIDEDRAVAERASRFPEALSELYPSEYAHASIWTPGRAVAECDLKTFLLAEHEPGAGSGMCLICHVSRCQFLLEMAAVYADHPDYRDEWSVR